MDLHRNGHYSGQKPSNIQKCGEENVDREIGVCSTKFASPDADDSGFGGECALNGECHEDTRCGKKRSQMDEVPPETFFWEAALLGSSTPYRADMFSTDKINSKSTKQPFKSMEADTEVLEIDLRRRCRSLSDHKGSFECSSQSQACRGQKTWFIGASDLRGVQYNCHGCQYKPCYKEAPACKQYTIAQSNQVNQTNLNTYFGASASYSDRQLCHVYRDADEKEITDEEQIQHKFIKHQAELPSQCVTNNILPKRKSVCLSTNSTDTCFNVYSNLVKVATTRHPVLDTKDDGRNAFGIDLNNNNVTDTGKQNMNYQLPRHSNIAYLTDQQRANRLDTSNFYHCNTDVEVKTRNCKPYLYTENTCVDTHKNDFKPRFYTENKSVDTKPIVVKPYCYTDITSVNTQERDCKQYLYSTNTSVNIKINNTGVETKTNGCKPCLYTDNTGVDTKTSCCKPCLYTDNTVETVQKDIYDTRTNSAVTNSDQDKRQYESVYSDVSDDEITEHLEKNIIKPVRCNTTDTDSTRDNADRFKSSSCTAPKCESKDLFKVSTRFRRKMKTPRKSASNKDPRFRGVTMWLQTEFKNGQSNLQISAFYSNVKSGCSPPNYHPAYQQDTTSPERYSFSDAEWSSPHQAVKVCASCRTRRTPLWRDAEDGTPLCNACGIRYKKYRLRCSKCWHIPKKEIKTYPNCPVCGGSLRYSFHKKTW